MEELRKKRSERQAQQKSQAGPSFVRTLGICPQNRKHLLPRTLKTCGNMHLREVWFVVKFITASVDFGNVGVCMQLLCRACRQGGAPLASNVDSLVAEILGAAGRSSELHAQICHLHVASKTCLRA